ncbi:MAG: VOC family protein [Crocinitomicaceae bacterium]|nr:VOC family protein [Crocinitomicaceae bacterium]
MSQNNHIDYIEFYAKDLDLIKTFYSACFNWKFTDYGANYTSFDSSGIKGGFEKTEADIVNGALIVLYHEDIDSCLEKIKKAGATISKELFSFPGGRRFQFLDPSGNELSVWTHK